MGNNGINRITENSFAGSSIFTVRFFFIGGEYICRGFTVLIYVFSRVFRKYNLLVNDLFTQNGRKDGLQFAVFFHIFQGFVAFFYQPDFRNSVFFEKSVYLII